MINYRNNHQKTLEGLVWFARNAPNLDHYWAVKTLFFADYYHLNRYGRPVFGDTIRAMDCGPVPSFALDLINRSEYAAREELQAACAAFDVTPSETGQRLVAKREPDLDLFSRTDLECLNQALDFCRQRSFRQLYEATHDLPAYRQAWDSRGASGSVPMDFALLVDDSPHREEIVDYMKETATAAVF